MTISDFVVRPSSSNDIIRIDDVPPPIVGNSIRGSGHLGHSLEPPLVMRAHIAIAPFFTVHFFCDGFEIWEIKPVITIADH